MGSGGSSSSSGLLTRGRHAKRSNGRVHLGFPVLLCARPGVVEAGDGPAALAPAQL
jgi:hypothetical protein